MNKITCGARKLIVRFDVGLSKAYTQQKTFGYKRQGIGFLCPHSTF